MTALLTWITLILVAVIVAVVAYHLIGIFVALKKTADSLEKLAGGLTQVRDDTGPLEGHIATINGGLTSLLQGLLGVNGDLETIVKVAKRQ